MISPQFLRRLAGGASVAVILLASVVLWGWSLSIKTLITVLPELPAMVPWTAFSLLILGLGYASAATRKQYPRWLCEIVRVVALGVAVVQFIFLLAPILGPLPELNRFFFHDQVTNFVADPNFGRSSPQTATCLVFLSLCLIQIFRARVNRKAIEFVAWVPVLICFVAIVGHLYSSLPFFGVSGNTGMAMHTAIALLLLSFAAMPLIHGPRFSSFVFATSPGSIATRNILLASLILPISLSLLLHLGEVWGFYGAAFSHALYVIIMTFSFAGLTMVTFREMRENLQLEGMRQGAEAANRAKSQFLAHMSHEIRTPLNAVLGFAELLQDPALAQRERDVAVRTILRNGTHLTRLIDEILDLTRTELNHLEIHREPFSPASLLHDLYDLLDLRATDKGLKLSFDISPDVPTAIFSDPGRLRQVLLNLVGNAIKFTQSGWVKVRVEAVARGSEWLLTFTIHDSGIGLSDEEKARIFQPFAQGDPSINRRFGGTGLGLSLSQRMARLMGGDVILVSSHRDKGSEFRLTIRAAGAVLPEIPTVVESVAAIGQKALAGLRVLIVDDSPDNRKLLETVLGREGITTEVAADGEEALEKIERQKYDVVLMDLQMPRRDGMSTVRELRRLGRKMPVIALTAHAMKGDRQECLDACFNDYITKPIDRFALLRLLESFRQLAPA